MICVTRITGESYDLNSGAELPKTIVLSNGFRELAVPVSEDIIRAIIEMKAQQDGIKSGLKEAMKKPVPKMPPAQRPNQHVEVETVVVPLDSDVRLNPELAAEPEPSDLPVAAQEEEGPGSDYDDPGTGVASL